jgi:hypothetical protein
MMSRRQREPRSRDPTPGKKSKSGDEVVDRIRATNALLKTVLG